MIFVITTFLIHVLLCHKKFYSFSITTFNGSIAASCLSALSSVVVVATASAVCSIFSSTPIGFDSSVCSGGFSVNLSSIAVSGWSRTTNFKLLRVGCFCG